MTKLLGGEFKNISLLKVVVSLDIKNLEKSNNKNIELKKNYEINLMKIQNSDICSVESAENNVDSKKLNLKDEDLL